MRKKSHLKKTTSSSTTMPYLKIKKGKRFVLRKNIKFFDIIIDKKELASRSKSFSKKA